MKKQWYDYLWIVSLTYLILGFFNILFAWLGLFCFFIPLIISVTNGTKGYCNRYCGRGQLFALLGGRFGLSRKKDMPKWMKSKGFRYGFLVFFFAMFFLMLWNTYLVFAGVQETGKIDYSVAHYYDHHCVGGYLAYGLFLNPDHHLVRDDNICLISWVIANHMEPFFDSHYYRELNPKWKWFIDTLHVRMIKFALQFQM